MIRQLARLGSLSAFIALIIFIGVVFAAVAAAQEPVPELTFAKESTDSGLGGQVSYTLVVTNSGGADSASQTIQDDLPPEFEWLLGPGNIECDIDTDDGAQVLLCGPFVVEKRHVNDDETDFVDGFAFITVYAEAQECGSWANTALLRNDRTGVATSSNVAVLTVDCPTPTPTATPTSPPATATPIPATPTPVVVVVTATPTFAVPTAPPTKGPSVVPLPPNTGDSAPPPGTDAASWLFITLALGAFTFAGGGYLLSRRR